MAKAPKGPTMDEYAAKRTKGGVRSVTISKAKNGFIVRAETDDYSNNNQEVYENLEGALGCAKKKLGGSK